MEVTKFKYSLDRRSKRITWGIIVLIVGLAVVFHFVWGTSYIPAWFLLFLLCIITLYILSFPRYLTIDDDALQIHCIVELTRIHVEEIEKIRRIDRDYFRRMIPLIGSYGFGGYYGYWFHLSDWEICKVYATERKQLVLIEDIYEDIYIVSCTDPDRLIELCMEARNRKRKQIRKTLEAAQKSTTQHAVEDQEKQEKEKVPGKQSSAPVSDATTDTSSDTSQKQQAKEETTDHSVKS
jgi:hypothetical protein